MTESFSALLVITADCLLGRPSSIPEEWKNYSRMAWMEPVVIRDGAHDFVLLSADEYRRLTGINPKSE